MSEQAKCPKCGSDNPNECIVLSTTGRQVQTGHCLAGEQAYQRGRQDERKWRDKQWRESLSDIQNAIESSYMESEANHAMDAFDSLSALLTTGPQDTEGEG